MYNQSCNFWKVLNKLQDPYHNQPATAASRHRCWQQGDCCFLFATCL